MRIDVGDEFGTADLAAFDVCHGGGRVFATVTATGGVEPALWLYLTRRSPAGP